MGEAESRPRPEPAAQAPSAAKKDRWAGLEPLALAATYLTYAIWYAEVYRPADFTVALVYVSLFWALFHALDACRAAKGIRSHAELRHLVAALNGLFYLLALHAIVDRTHPDWGGLAVLSLATAYLWTGLWIQNRQADASMVRDRHYLAALLLLVAATAIQFSGFLVIVFWTLEAAALCWCGFRWRQPALRGIAFALMAFSFLVLYSMDGALQHRSARDFNPLLNLRVLAFVVLAAGFRRRQAVLRIISLALSGFVIFKIFLYDLSFLRTPYRIVAFFGLGLILLVVSYTLSAISVHHPRCRLPTWKKARLGGFAGGNGGISNILRGVERETYPMFKSLLRVPVLLGMVHLTTLAAAASDGGWRAAAYFGGSATHRSGVTIDQPALATHLRFDGVEYEGRSFQTPVYYGYRLGYWFNPRLGLEAEFIHQKVYARVERLVRVDGTLRGAPLSAVVPMDGIVREFSISHGVNLLLANLVFCHQPAGAGGRLTLSGRIGAGGSVPHPESNILGQSRQGYQWGRPAIQVAAGVEYRLWRDLHWLAEYKYTRTRQRVEIVDGTAGTLLRSHHAVFGLGYRF